MRCLLCNASEMRHRSAQQAYNFVGKGLDNERSRAYVQS